jgi:hypothetical protein
MGNLRKQASKRGRKTRAANLRAAARERRLLAMAADVDPLGVFESRYPTVPAAVAAAEAGEEVSVVFGTIADVRLAVVVGDSGPVLRTTAFPGVELHDLLATAVLNHPEPEQPVAGIVAALAEHLAAFGVFPGVEVVCEPTGGAVPRFGWQASFDAGDLESWEQFWAMHRRSLMGRVVDLTGWGGATDDLTDGVFGIFQAHGLTVVRCQVCGHPLTDRHPAWLGVWISIDPERGPVCQTQLCRPGLDSLAEYDRIDVGSGHRPTSREHGVAAAVGRP